MKLGCPLNRNIRHAILVIIYSEVRLMSQKEIEFAVFCIENIAEYLKMDARDVYHLLGVKSKILFEYIVPCYEPLHTQSKEYIVRDVVDLMREKGLIE